MAAELLGAGRRVALCAPDGLPAPPGAVPQLASAAAPLAALAEQGLDAGGRHRPPHQEALAVAAAHLAQELQLDRVLDALRDDVKVQSVRQGDDGLHDRPVACVGAEIADK